MYHSKGGFRSYQAHTPDNENMWYRAVEAQGHTRDSHHAHDQLEPQACGTVYCLQFPDCSEQQGLGKHCLV